MFDINIFEQVKKLVKYERTELNSNRYFDLLLALQSQCVDVPYYKKEVNKYLRRLKTLRKRLNHMFITYPDCYFVTFTFTDDVLSSTSDATRRLYISRVLRGNEYVANIDFGKTTGREHYHAVVNAFISDEQYPYGFKNVERIRLDFDEVGNCLSTRRLSKYVAKLANHALKGTTRLQRLMYSRNLLNIQVEEPDAIVVPLKRSKSWGVALRLSDDFNFDR